MIKIKLKTLFFSFYSDLYQSKVEYSMALLRDFLDPLKLPSLSSVVREELNAPLTLEELRRAVLEAPNNKAPGLDGLPSEVYKYYGDILLPELLKVLNHAWETFKLPDSMNEACIIVLLKPDKDPLAPESYRPISLLNSDAKILTRILAARLGRVMQGLIHPDQSGFIHTRSTAINLRSLYLNMQLQ